MAAWPDPEGIDAKPVWQMTDEEAAASPLVAFRASAVEACHEWRRAAQADGWSIRATYVHEPLEQAWTGERDGFKVQGIARQLGVTAGARLPSASISIWGPDSMSIPPMPVYDWALIQRRVRQCMECDQHPVTTVRVGFATRLCLLCAVKLRPSIEHQGWCD